MFIEYKNIFSFTYNKYNYYETILSTIEWPVFAAKLS